MKEKYKPRNFWENAHSEVPLESVGDGEGIRSVGGGGNFQESSYLYKLRESAFRRAADALGEQELPSVLEFGCGAGYWIERLPGILQSKGIRYTGADISQTSVERLIQRYPKLHFVCLDSNEDGWKELKRVPKFNLVLAIDVLYHITDDKIWENEIVNLCSVLDDGGSFMFTDYGYDQPTSSPSTSHVKHRALQAYFDILDKHGLVLDRIAPMFFLFNRIKYGPMRDHGTILAGIWKLADRLRPVLWLLYLLDSIITLLIRPMHLRCKKRVFLFTKVPNMSNP